MAALFQILEDIEQMPIESLLAYAIHKYRAENRGDMPLAFAVNLIVFDRLIQESHEIIHNADGVMFILGVELKIIPSIDPPRLVGRPTKDWFL